MVDPAGVSDDGAARRKTDGPESDGRLRVLAVDDDRAYLSYLRLVLTRAGFNVELATNGPTAIDRIRTAPAFDLLIVDLNMPDMDGIETVRRIQSEARLPSLYTILLTASSGTDVKLRALESGLDDFLSKASGESEIIAKIRSAARRLEMERRMAIQNEELQLLALTDELTGIANRRALFRAADSILRSGRSLAVALFDLDRFKQINDTYGHVIGDKILADVGAMFKAHTRFGDVVGRYGGDEFVLLVPCGTVDEAKAIARRLTNKIRHLTWTIGGSRLSVNAQCGTASSPADGTNLGELLAACDRLLYRRKRKKAAKMAAAAVEERPRV